MFNKRQLRPPLDGGMLKSSIFHDLILALDSKPTPSGLRGGEGFRSETRQEFPVAPLADSLSDFRYHWKLAIPNLLLHG